MKHNLLMTLFTVITTLTLSTAAFANCDLKIRRGSDNNGNSFSLSSSVFELAEDKGYNPINSTFDADFILFTRAHCASNMFGAVFCKTEVQMVHSLTQEVVGLETATTSSYYSGNISVVDPLSNMPDCQEALALLGM